MGIGFCPIERYVDLKLFLVFLVVNCCWIDVRALHVFGVMVLLCNVHMIWSPFMICYFNSGFIIGSFVHWQYF